MHIDQREQAWKLYESGMTIAQIATELGISIIRARIALRFGRCPGCGALAQLLRAGECRACDLRAILRASGVGDRLKQ